MDEAEDEAQEARDAEAAEKAARERAPKPMDQGGGMYFYEVCWVGGSVGVHVMWGLGLGG